MKPTFSINSSNFFFLIKLYMFRTVPPFIIRSFSLYTQQCYMSYRFSDSKLVWHIPLLCVQWKTADDERRNCPKHTGSYSKNKFEKLVHLFGFIIRISWKVCFDSSCVELIMLIIDDITLLTWYILFPFMFIICYMFVVSHLTHFLLCFFSSNSNVNYNILRNHKIQHI